MKNSEIFQVMSILEKWSLKVETPIVTLYSNEQKPPFQILITTIISLRTKDEVTAIVSKKLFATFSSPEDFTNIEENKLAKLLYPAGFYKTKAKNIKKISAIIINQYKGIVPNDIDELLKLPGVGRKTANLVVTLGYNKPGICVDTHVHRITNRWGYIKTKKPDDTEFALRKKLPEQYWVDINNYLVAFGQNICRPISPFCSKCPLEQFCSKKNVETSR